MSVKMKGCTIHQPANLPVVSFPPPKPKQHYSVARLEALPGYWRGAAGVRRQAALEAAERGEQREADRHARIASEHERKADDCARYGR